MYHNFVYKDVNEALPDLCTTILNSGEEVGSRLGDRTMELTHVGITLTDPSCREITLPTRRANVVAQIAETMWVLGGRDDVAWLRNYLPRAEDFSDDGERWRGAYGPRLRAWDSGDHLYHIDHIDQLQKVVQLLRKDRTTRRAVMSIYDPVRDAQPGKDIPCNNWLSFISRGGALDLHVAIRSNDLIWGWSGINAFEWSALLEIVAGLVGCAVGSLHFSITSLHIYDRHWSRADKLRRDVPLITTAPSPRSQIRSLDQLDTLTDQWFILEEKLRTGGEDHFTESDVNLFPDPLLRSWLQVIAYRWTGDTSYISTLAGTPLFYAACISQPTKKEI